MCYPNSHCEDELVNQRPDVGPLEVEETGFKYVGFWKRVLAILIDTAIGVAFNPIIMPFMYWSLQNRNISLYISWNVIWTIVWLWLVVRFGGTPGKLIVGARIVDRRASFLSWVRAIRRIIPSVVGSVISILAFRAAAIHYPSFVTPPSSLMELGRFMAEYGQPYILFSSLLGWFVYIDFGAILLNKKKRAIHDFIAGSYVITRTSYDQMNAKPGGAPSPGKAAAQLV